MLDAWRAVPDVELGRAIALVGEHAARALHPPGGVTDDDRDAAWHAAAALGDPVMRHRLIETVTDTANDRAQVARLEALVGAHDPRVASAILVMLARASVRYDIPTRWRPLCKLLVACGDPQVREAIAAIDWEPRLARLTDRERAAAQLRIGKLTKQLAAAYPEVPALAPSEAARVGAIVALLDRPRHDTSRDAAIEAGLLAAIYQTPADDGPRAIYADWLQERGDPRGEFIALQLARDPRANRWDRTPETARIDTLLEQHAERWLGALGACLAPQHVDFERGFVATARVGAGKPTPDDPAWATVRAIRGAIPATDANPMPILTEATDLDRPALVALAKLAAPPPIATLGWRSRNDDWSPTGGFRADTQHAIDAFARVVDRLPQLRRLELIGTQSWIAGKMRPDQLGWRWRDTTIRELRVTASLDQLGAWFAAVASSELLVFELGTMYPYGWRIELDRGTHGSLVIKDDQNRYTFDASLPAICAAIERLPRDWLADLEMTVPAKDLWTLPHRRRMAAALDHHPRVRAQIAGFSRPKR